MKGCSKMEMELQLSMNAEQTKIVIKILKDRWSGRRRCNELYLYSIIGRQLIDTT